MRKTAFIAIFSILLISSISGQDIPETFEFAEKLFAGGNYKSALTEFQRVAFFDSEKKYPQVYQKIGDFFYSLADFDKAAVNYEIASKIIQNDSLSYELMFQKVLCFFKQGKYYFALNELLGFPNFNSSYFQNKLELYLGITYFGIENFQEAKKYFGKLVGNNENLQLDNIFESFNKFQKKYDPDKIRFLSILFPGLGQYYMGQIFSGLNSTVLVGGMAIITVFIWQTYGFFDAILSMSSWYYRYYSGGFRNARNLALDKIAHEKEETYKNILEIIQKENNLSQ